MLCYLVTVLTRVNTVLIYHTHYWAWHGQKHEQTLTNKHSRTSFSPWALPRLHYSANLYHQLWVTCLISHILFITAAGIRRCRDRVLASLCAPPMPHSSVCMAAVSWSTYTKPAARVKPCSAATLPLQEHARHMCLDIHWKPCGGRWQSYRPLRIHKQRDASDAPFSRSIVLRSHACIALRSQACIPLRIHKQRDAPDAPSYPTRTEGVL